MKSDSFVLIVEDAALIAMTLEGELLALGYHAECAFRREDALRLLSARRPAFAIINYVLKGATTAPIAYALDELGIPFIVCTGSAQARTDPHFSRATFLDKPFRTDELIAAIETLPPAAFRRARTAGR